VKKGAPREHFIAYYKPEHRILRLAAPFFTERFAIMRWTILTPDETASWNPDTKQLHFGPGVPRDHAPADSDADLEDLWRGYYGAIFNPARVNPAVMRREMPIRYWEHLPELTLLPTLLQRAEDRVAIMVAKQSKLSAAPFVPAKHSLPILRAAMPKCEGCDLYKHAIQVVPGAGAAHARLMLVGEQPGDQEDQQGEPFVGPAGGVLRRALAELNIEPKTIFLTNAVKHFKFVERGKLRLHQSPRMSEVSACRPWLEAEIDAVKPKVVLAMGATAAKSLFGSTFHLMEQHGQLIASKYAQQAMATVHPSAILRAPDEEARHQLYALMKTDLERAHTASLAAK
jgi:uracil-DNA glycosylase family protein